MKEGKGVKSFWPIFANRLGDTDLKRRHEAYALFLKGFQTALSSIRVTFADYCAVYRNPLPWNVICLKQAETSLPNHPPHVMIWRSVTDSHVIGTNFFDGTLICVPYLETFSSYARAYQHRDHSIGKVLEKWCPTLFHPDGA
jgi:hypothetical protein